MKRPPQEVENKPRAREKQIFYQIKFPENRILGENRGQFNASCSVTQSILMPKVHIAHMSFKHSIIFSANWLTEKIITITIQNISTRGWVHVDEIQPRRLCANIDYTGPSGFEFKKKIQMFSTLLLQYRHLPWIRLYLFENKANSSREENLWIKSFKINHWLRRKRND